MNTEGNQIQLFMSKFYGYIGDFVVRTSEIDSNKRLKIPALIQLLQEASMQNVLSLKLSVWDLEDEKLSWVLLKKEIKINTLPTVGQPIRIKTYPAGFHRIFAYRDFIVMDEHNNILATAASVWGLINTQTRKLMTIPPYEFYNIIPDEILEKPNFKLSAKMEAQYSRPTNIVWHNLDWNGHVNNIVLIQSMLDAIPNEYLNSKQLQSLQLQFKSESILGDDLESNCRITDNEILHQIIRPADNSIIALARSIWIN